MKIKNLGNKEILWSVLTKYDNHSDYRNFCDSLSRFIQGTFDGDDMLVVYKHSNLIDAEDRVKIDSTIGGHIDAYLFAI